jgi:hypothetical protein
MFDPSPLSRIHKLDMFDPSPLPCIHLLCLLAMREGSRIVDYIAYYGVLLISLWFSLRDIRIITRERHRRNRWSSCQPKADYGNLVVALRFRLRDDNIVIVRRLYCHRKRCRLHVYHLNIVIALQVRIEDVLEVIRK